MILFNEKNNTITLQTKRSTYQMKIDSYGVLMHTYYGKKVRNGDMSNLVRHDDRGFSPNPPEAVLDNRRDYSLDTIPQEFSSCGVGDFRQRSIELELTDGSYTADFRYVGHEIKNGKYGLEGLPAFYAAEDEAQTLIVTLRDCFSQIEAELLYSVMEEQDLITRSVRIRNIGDNPVYLNRIMSLCLDMQRADYELLYLGGAYGREREIRRMALNQGCFQVESVRGASSHQHNPFAVLCEKGTDEHAGSCIGMALVYSGNFLIAAEQTQFEHTRVLMGIHPFHFHFRLHAGEVFTAPEVAMVYSDTGLGDMSRKFHRVIRNHLCRGYWKNRKRPLLINNWEATEFNFDEDKIVSIAQTAADVGIEMMVMDDGWFGHRNDDLGGLGDWYINKSKLPNGLPALVKRIQALGMKFGIWVELEMVSEDSDLYQKHPDWAFRLPHRPPTKGRSQLVLDLTREDVREYLYSSLADLLRSADISYIKWDMNRSLTDVWSHAFPAQQQGEIYHRYVLGLYDILERLHQEFPEVLLEGCSGGGGRFDCGMLYYEPQIWCSDNTDAMDRLRIQYGTLFCYPASTIGAHVSAVPNCLTGRRVDMHTRGVAAMSGTFGYEMDLKKLDEADLQEVRTQVQAFHKYYDIVAEGEYYRLTNPFENTPYTAWMFVSDDRSRALISIVQGTIHANPIRPSLRLDGLDETKTYRLHGEIYGGDQLMYAGIPCPLLEEYEAVQLYLEEV